MPKEPVTFSEFKSWCAGAILPTSCTAKTVWHFAEGYHVGSRVQYWKVETEDFNCDMGYRQFKSVGKIAEGVVTWISGQSFSVDWLRAVEQIDRGSGNETPRESSLEDLPSTQDLASYEEGGNLGATPEAMGLLSPMLLQLQVSTENPAQDPVVTCRSLGGEVLASVTVAREDDERMLRTKIAAAVRAPHGLDSLVLVLPEGQRLCDVVWPRATAPAHQTDPRD